MARKDKRRSSLSKHQARALRNYELILEATGLNPELILDIAENDPEAVIPVLGWMTDQVVRGEVILEYTMIDSELDYILLRHFFGSVRKLRAARRTRRYKTLSLMLQNIYLMQKLSIVRGFKKFQSLSSAISPRLTICGTGWHTPFSCLT